MASIYRSLVRCNSPLATVIAELRIMLVRGNFPQNHEGKLRSVGSRSEQKREQKHPFLATYRTGPYSGLLPRLRSPGTCSSRAIWDLMHIQWSLFSEAWFWFRPE